MSSPYEGIPKEKWLSITKRLVAKHPLYHEWVDIVNASWESIFSSKIGRHGFRIGKEIFPRPQIIGYLLQELIALEAAARFPGVWRGDTEKSEKDLVYVHDSAYSVEVKTSSNNAKVFANRSYAQPDEIGKKVKLKSGYYLTVNYGKFVKDSAANPKVKKIAFGWLDHADWIAQKSAKGQAASLPPHIYESKLIKLYPKD